MLPQLANRGLLWRNPKVRVDFYLTLDNFVLNLLLPDHPNDQWLFDLRGIPMISDYRVIKIVLVLVFTLLLPEIAIAYSGGPLDARTGAPGELTCADGCHATNALNSGDGSVVISGLPAQYTFSQTYPITVTVDNSSQSRWGFELAALTSGGDQAGTITATDTDSTQTSVASGIIYIKHTSIGTRPATMGPRSWVFDWTAPASDIGEVTLYAAGNAANNDNTNSNDFIYTSSASAIATQTTVSGVIATAVWHVDESPYHVTGDITIPVGNTLTIEPGVDVLFDIDARFLVQGAIEAYGTPSDSIRFMVGTAAEWGGLELTSLTADTSYLEYVRISGGHAANGDGGGARIANTVVSAELSNCVISGNVADNSGGGLAIDGAKRVSLDRCTIINNRATHLSNSKGGGVFVTSSATDVTITNCTIVSNVSGNPDFGTNTKNGVYVQSGTVDMLNTIVWGRGNGVSAIDEFGGTFTANYCVIDGGKPDGVDGANNLSDDPIFTDAAAGDFSVTISSPAINAGDPTADNDPDGTRADIGAIPLDLVAAGYVFGQIPTTTWTAVNSPYRVFGALWNTVGQTLTIEPGVDVQIYGDGYVSMGGELQAVGTVEDSIRFISGPASQWGGLRINTNAVEDTSRLSYVRLSGGYATGASGHGGGLRIAGTNTKVALDNSVISHNQSDSHGGGVYIVSASVTFDRCVIAHNVIRKPLPGDPMITYAGGGMYLASNATVDMTNCTVYDNVANTSNNGWSGTSGVFIGSSGTVVNITNSVMWFRGMGWGALDVSGGTVNVDYCIIDASVLDSDASGTGNQLGVDPLFTNAIAGDFSIPIESPALNGGDPESPVDPDGSRADIGAIPFDLATSGFIYGDIASATWTVEDSPYDIFEASVPAGEFLSIQPGVSVIFHRNTTFPVAGQIGVYGAAEDSVYFEPAEGNDWKGIAISGGDSSFMEYAVITGSKASGITLAGAETRFGLYNSKIAGNSGANGAGISVDSASLTLENCVVSANVASNYGGGIHLSGLGNVTVLNSLLKTNSANGAGGGGMHVASGEALVTNSTITGNVGRYGSGLDAAGADASLTAVGCVLTQGFATSDGLGAGAYAWSGAQLTLESCTIAGNIQSLGGGGVAVAQGGIATLHNCIAWNNGTVNLLNLGVNPGTLTATYSDIAGGFEGDGNIDADPMFVSIADFRLTSGSPALDAGDPTNPFDSDGTAIEMGAFPFVGARFVTTELPHATERQGYEVRIHATHPTSEAITYVRIEGPEWLGIGNPFSDSTANLSGYPFESHVAENVLVTVMARTELDSSYQTFHFDVVDTNYAPKIDVPASQLSDVLDGQAYSDTIRASDPDEGDVLTYSIDDADGLTGLAFDDSVLTHAGFRTSHAGDYVLTIRVADQTGTFITTALALHIGNIVGIASSVLPSRTELLGNRPNPFNPTTAIAYALAEEAEVNLTVYDLRGSVVRLLVDGVAAAGYHTVTWDGLDAQGRNSASGVYLVRFTAGTLVTSQRISLIR
jgi:hypothetical protein